MSSFPAYAKLDQQGFKKTSGQSVLRSPMEDGFVKQMKWRAKTLRTRTVLYALDTLANRNSFEVWVDTTLNMGADWFDWTDPVSGTVRTARIVEGSKGVTYTLVSGSLVYWTAAFSIETYE